MAHLRTLGMKQTIVAVALASAVACGGGSSNPNNPSPGGGSPGPSGATITIGANRTVTPSQVTINPGESVTFVNNDTIPHDMASDPHPAHGDCPALNAVGTLSPGATRLSNALTTSRTCGFHDHNDPTNAALQGRITIR
jgi:plastocyanin